MIIMETIFAVIGVIYIAKTIASGIKIDTKSKKKKKKKRKAEALDLQQTASE